MYDFKLLSDYDFEILSKDLLEKKLGYDLESFAKGRDNGIDLRYSGVQKNELIIQCKHYANSSFSSLKSNLINAELPKIKKLNPTRYIVVTSLALTPNKKDELQRILSPYCKNTGDIIGMNELNDLLRKNKDVEIRHYKLWLTSSAVLDKILNSGVYTRSEITKNQIQEKLKFYVQNKAFFRAIGILNELNYCIVSGVPGIGKSTLAEMLLIRFLDDGFEIIKIAQNIREAYDVYDSRKKQIFYYDDFLGQIGRDTKINKNEDSDILEFLKCVRKNSNSKFILTTREYILNQAKATNEHLYHSDFDAKKCVLLLSDYTKLDRAKILYNHIFFNNLPKKYIDNLLKNDILKIVNHKNYNPRIIGLLVNPNSLLPEDPQVFFKSIINNLDNPTEIWRFAFEKHISKEAQDMLFILASLPLDSSIETASIIFKAYHSAKSRIYQNCYNENDFKNAIKELDGNFILTDDKAINFNNPSINDFLDNYIAENGAEFELLCETAMAFAQCVSLYNLSARKNHSLIKKFSTAFINALFRNFYSELSIKNPIWRFNSIWKLNYDESIIDRLIFLLRVNKDLKNNLISDYIKNLLNNLPNNFFTWDVSLEEYAGLLNYIYLSKQNNLISSDGINAIINYAISVIRKDYEVVIKDFIIFTIIEKGSFSTLSKELKTEMAKHFYKVQEEEVESFLDWGSNELIDDYKGDIENLGQYFCVDIKTTLEYLDGQKSDIDEEDSICASTDVVQEEQVSDADMKNMFESLRH